MKDLRGQCIKIGSKIGSKDIAKLTLVPNDLAKLSNAVKNDVAKKTEYDK